MAPIRLAVWAIRGMTMGRTFIADPHGMEEAVALLSRLIERAVPSGKYQDLTAI